MDWTAFWYYCGWAGIFTGSFAMIVCGMGGLAYGAENAEKASVPRMILAGLSVVFGATILFGAFNATSYATGPHHDQKPLAGVAATQVEGEK